MRWFPFRCALLLFACALPAAALPVAAQPAGFQTGADRMTADGFAAWHGKRVGLVTNHTAVLDTSAGRPAHLIDAVAEAEGVRLAALFGPEHGLRGTAEAGERVEGGVDRQTGARVVSLYGQTKRPPPESLEGLDLLAFDMQDVGARFYTYLATMGYAMQAAAEAGLPFWVLDRPNPLGRAAEGFVLEPEHASFVGLYPVPQRHGLTAGELARIIQGEGWLPGLDSLRLRVVEMAGYDADAGWPAGRPFVPTSPNIPDLGTARVYAGTGLFEGTTASEGRGTPRPFHLVGAPWADSTALADSLNAVGLPGVWFRAAAFMPESIPGAASSPKHEGVALGGVEVVVTDAARFRPVETGVYVLDAFYRMAPEAEREAFFDAAWLAKLAGTGRLRELIESGADPAAIAEAWHVEVRAFETRAAPYWIYP